MIWSSCRHHGFSIGDRGYAALKTFRVAALDIIFKVIGHRRTAAMALVEALAVFTGMDPQSAEGGEDLRVIPDLLEAALPQVARFEAIALQEGAGVDLAGRADAAGQLGGTAEVQPQALSLLGGQREEAVTGADSLV